MTSRGRMAILPVMNIWLTILGLPAVILTAFPALAQPGPAAFTTGYRYDADRRPTGTISPDPDEGGPLRYAAVRNSYDPAGRLTKVEKGQLADWQSEAIAPTAWAGFTVLQTIDLAHDALDRKVREAVSGVDSTGSAASLRTVTESSYDLDGRPRCTAVRMNPDHWSTPLADTCVTGPVHGVWGPDRIARSDHDPAGQLVQSWEGVGTGDPADLAAEATRVYDGNGRLRFLIDAKGNKSEMRYDGLGRLECWILPSPNGPGAYDPTSQTSALATAGSVNGDCVSSGDFEYYTHDANGNRTSLRNRAGDTLGYSYDALNRVTFKDRPGSELDVAYAYDLRGLQLGASFPSTGESITSAWDGFGRIVSSTTTRGGVAVAYAYQYDSDGHRIAITHPDGVAFAYDRDGLGRVSAIRLGGATLIAIAYDAMGRRKSLARGDGSAASYGYDGASRLIHLFDDLPAAGDRDVALTYNPASQIDTRIVDNALYAWTGHGNGSTETPADGLNRITAHGGTALSYDAKGNMIWDGTRAFAYDSENRLVLPAWPYHYDPHGRLAGASLSPGGPLAIVYDNSEGEGLIAEHWPGNLAPLRRHVFGPGVDEPLIWYEGSGTAAPRYLHADERGSIVAVTDGSGAVQNVNAYDEYGRTQNTNPYWQSRFAYTGQRYFGGNGLSYYKARFYHTKLGRFMQVDPIGYDDQINLYAYVGNDPVNKTDPDGKAGIVAAAPILCAGPQAVACALIGGAIIGAVIVATVIKEGNDAGTGGDGRRLSSNDNGGPPDKPLPVATPTDQITDRQLTRPTLEAARKELAGQVVTRKPGGQPFDHVTKVRNAQQGLQNRIEQLRNRLGHPRISDNERRGLSDELKKASRALDESRRYVPR